MNSKSFVKLSLIIVATAVIIGNTNIIVKSSFAEIVKSFHGGSANSFAQACDAFKCITKEDHGDGKPGSPSTAIASSCFDFLDINLCDTTPTSSKNN
jgi:hypothetical protein